MKVFDWRAAACVLALTLSCVAAPADTSSRKAALKLAARVADWQLANMDASQPGITSFAAETRNTRSWQQGAFWVGLTRFADVSGEPRFRGCY